MFIQFIYVLEAVVCDTDQFYLVDNWKVFSAH